tara:strand:- start:599 stop:937 length:339 start_codon:yes stop_codon:yes gene_type:complete
MKKIKVEYMNGKVTIYDVDYPKAYIAKIIEAENDLLLDKKSVNKIYANDKLIAQFKDGFLNELVLAYAYKKKLKPNAGCDVGQYAVNATNKSSWVTDHTGGDIEINYIPKSL